MYRKNVGMKTHKQTTLPLSVSVDGSEDGEINCLQDGGVVAQARADIKTDTVTLLAPHDVTDNDDPFQDFDLSSDEQQQEENEILDED